jgi:DNA-binding response OmpR family regulator
MGISDPHLFLPQTAGLWACLLLLPACLACGIIIYRTRKRKAGERAATLLHMANGMRTPVVLMKVLLNELGRESLPGQSRKSLLAAQAHADKLSVLVDELTDRLRPEDAAAGGGENGDGGGAAAGPASAGEPATEGPSEKELLLLAGHDDDMRAYLSARLAPEYRVESVADGIRAIARARELNPDIILSDVPMPGLRGAEMCRMLKSSIETSHIPVILLTALSEKEDIILGLEAGADDYITKPFDLTVLKARIRNILHNREKLRSLVLASRKDLNDTDYANPLDKEFIAKAILVIEKEMDNAGFSVGDFCRNLGMSRTSVYNKIKTLTNLGPNDFIRIIRLNKAKELLKEKKYPVAEIAGMVGFSDPKYFSTSFKKQFGVSPSKVDKDT